METVESIIEKLDRIRNLPTLPVVMQKISSAIRDPNSDARTIAHLIEDDPAIAARILKVVNSSLYSGGVEIQSVHQAVSRLGLTATNNIALSTSVFSAFQGVAHDGFDRKAFWRHSISVGIAASVLYTHAVSHLTMKFTVDRLRLAGLLHDIGKLIMDQYITEDFLKALERARTKPMPLSDAEMEIIGADHAMLGAWLASKWNLSDDLVLAIHSHHAPEAAPKGHWELIALCHIANYICNQEKIGNGGDLAAPSCIHAMWTRLGLSVADISVVVDKINEESKKSDILLALA